MKFNIKLPDKSCKEIDGTLVKNLPIKCFAHKHVTSLTESDGWVVSEFFSGMRITRAHKLRKDAVEEAIIQFETRGVDAIKELVNTLVKKYGFANKDGTQRKVEKEQE